MKALQESVAKKIKDMNTSKSKSNYKSVEEIGESLILTMMEVLAYAECTAITSKMLASSKKTATATYAYVSGQSTHFTFPYYRDLEKQVESGTMRLVEEKKALSEVSELRRARKTFDTFGSAQESIDADKAKIEELKSTLDNPEYKSLNERYEAIQKELDELNQELDAGNKNRDALYDERNKLHEEVNALWSRKKESAGNFKEANDRYC